MNYKEFIKQIEDFAYGKTEVTMSMPFKDYNELLLDLMNTPSFIMQPTMDIIKHFRLNGVLVNIVEGDNVGLGDGGPKENQKFFRMFSFQHDMIPTTPKSGIPSDATNLEVFHIKDNEAYIGFKISNGNFHFIQVPYNPGRQEAKVIQMQTLPHRA